MRKRRIRRRERGGGRNEGGEVGEKHERVNECIL